MSAGAGVPRAHHALQRAYLSRLTPQPKQTRFRHVATSSPELADMRVPMQESRTEISARVIGVMPTLCRLLAGRERSRRSRSVTAVPSQGPLTGNPGRCHKQGLLEPILILILAVGAYVGA